MFEFSTADLIDDFGELCHSCWIQFSSFGTASRFSGRIRTVLSYDDNVLLRQLLSSPGAGSVAVVDGAGFLGSALLGDQMAELAIRNGWSGVILHGAVRDKVALSRLPIGVKALGTNPHKSGKRGVGVVDIPLTFGGVTFTPSEWIYTDEDGIIVSPQPLLGER